MTILVAEAVEPRPGQPLWVQTHDVTYAYVRDDHPNPATPHASHESRAPSIGKIVRKVMEQKLARENAVAAAVKDMLSDADIAEKLPTVPTSNA